MSNVLIQRLIVVFGEPDSAAPEKFLAEYERLTKGFSERVLEKAADRLIAAGGRRWPTPKACMDACTDAQEFVFGQPNDSNYHLSFEVKRREAHAWARQFCDVTPLGRQAKAEGWEIDLFYYAVSYARNCPPDKALMPMTDWRPPEDIIEMYRKMGIKAA